MNPKHRALLTSLGLLAMATACGVRKPPRPPEDTMPRAAIELVARRDGDAVRLRWIRPEKSADGERLDDLAGFVIERRSGTGAFEWLAEVPADTTHRLRPIRAYSFADTEAPGGTVEYRVIPYSEDGQRGPPTPPATVTDREPAP